nr:unnamed protein product [Callosobruchus chinensis]
MHDHKNTTSIALIVSSDIFYTLLRQTLKKLLRPSTIPTEEQIQNELDLPAVVDHLTSYLMHNSIQTKVAVLKWIHDLYTKLPNKMVNYIDVLFPALQKTLSDESDQVVQQCLVVLAEVISTPKSAKAGDTVPDTNEYYHKFMVSLLLSFSLDKRLLVERGSFIIRQLCVLLNAEDLYTTLAQILLKETNLKFASLMVEHLNMILFTSSELYEALFCCLYDTWCHNPVATVALCLLSQSYSHSCELIKLFGNLEITI